MTAADQLRDQLRRATAREPANDWHLRRAAIHESSHAVLGRLLLGSAACGGATIVGDEKRSGYARVSSKRASPAQAVIIALSGGAAERLLLTKHDLPVDGDFDQLDKQQVERLIENHHLTDLDIARFTRMADDLVAEHFASIRRVAAALIKHKTLGASEIDRILNKKE